MSQPLVPTWPPSDGNRIAAVAVSEIPYDLITMAAPTASDRVYLLPQNCAFPGGDPGPL